MNTKHLNSTSTDDLKNHRGVVTIADAINIHHVYLGRNAVPESVAEAIVRALRFVWLPRFEASEWATAFIAAAKPLGHLLSCDRPSPFGLVRLTQDWRTHEDLSFRYLVTAKKQALWIIAMSREGADTKDYSGLFEGTLDGFCAFAEVDPECVHLMTLPSRHASELSTAKPRESPDPLVDPRPRSKR